jgi:hypothetical protein
MRPTEAGRSILLTQVSKEMDFRLRGNDVTYLEALAKAGANRPEPYADMTMN